MLSTAVLTVLTIYYCYLCLQPALMFSARWHSQQVSATLGQHGCSSKHGKSHQFRRDQCQQSSAALSMFNMSGGLGGDCRYIMKLSYQ